MGKRRGGAKQRVADYFLSIHFGICSGPINAIKKIWISEKVAWEGNLTDTGVININRPDLFGGPQKEGGPVGNVHALFGKGDQLLEDSLASRIGGTPTSVPGYRGMGSLWFTGYQSASSGYGIEDFGEVTSYGGFKWGSNSPVIQSVWATVSRTPIGLNPATAMIGDNANPSHMIYECLSNSDWGMGAPSVAFNVASFEAAATTLFNENFGLSMMWTRQTEIENFVNEILDHIQAMVFVNPADGLLTIKLLRDDYDPETVREVNPDNAKLGNYERKMWGETTNEIVVTWTNPENEQEETLTLQDLSNVAIQGSPAQGSRNYYGVRNKELAERLAARDLRQTAYPLAIAEAKLDRRWWGILPGDVVRLEWPERNITGLYMRVRGADYGKIGSGEITVNLKEDIISLNKVRAYVPPASQAPSVSEAPRDIDNALLINYPAHWISVASLGNPSDYDSTESVVGVLAYQNSTDTYGFDLLTEQVDTTGTTVFRNDGQKSLVGLSTLSASLGRSVLSYLPSLPPAGVGVVPQAGGWVIIGTTETSQEICLVGPLTASGWTIYRGMLDTIPRAWASGTEIRYLPSPLLTVDGLNVRAPGEIVDYKLLTKTSLGVLSEAAASVRSGTASQRMHRPLRPANVVINGVAIGGTVNVSAATDIAINWSTRNRLVEEVTAPMWDAGSETPEYRQRTIVRVLTTGGALIREYNHLWTENGYTIPKVWYANYASVIIRIFSERNAIESLQYSEFTITGLANDSGAVPPPDVPEPEEPESPTLPPSPTGFSLEGGVIGLPDGGKLPGLSVIGDPGDADADHGLIRYRILSGTTSIWYDVDIWNDSDIWYDSPTLTAVEPWKMGSRFDANPGFIRVPVGVVAPNVTYEVGIAYVKDSIRSSWVSLGNAATGEISQASLDQVTGLVIQSDWTGVVLQGQSGTVKMVRRLGTEDVSNSTNWNVGAIGCTATISTTGLVTLNLSAPIADVAKIVVTSNRDGVLIQASFDVSKTRAAKPQDPGVNAGSLAEDPTIGQINSNSFVGAQGGPITVKAGPSGVANCYAGLSFTTSSISNRDVSGKVQWRVAGGSWADVAGETASSFPARAGTEPELGQIEISASKTGLTPGTNYEFQLLLRGTSGVTSSIVWFFGNFTVDSRA